MHSDVLEDARAREAFDRERVQATRIALLGSVTQLGIRPDLNMPILMMSGCADQPECGASAWLSKPFKASQRQIWRGWMGIEPTQAPQQRPADGFEDRVSDVRHCPPTSAQDENSIARIR
jgi:hypothetical protein